MQTGKRLKGKIMNMPVEATLEITDYNRMNNLRGGATFASIWYLFCWNKNPSDSNQFSLSRSEERVCNKRIETNRNKTFTTTMAQIYCSVIKWCSVENERKFINRKLRKVHAVADGPPARYTNQMCPIVFNPGHGCDTHVNASTHGLIHFHLINL